MTLKGDANLKVVFLYGGLVPFIYNQLNVKIDIWRRKNIRHAMLMKFTEIVVCTYIF